MRVRIRGKSCFAFETLPPPLRGPPPSTEGGEGCAVDLNVGQGFAPADLQGKVTSPLESHKDSFVDPRAGHGFCIGSLRLIVMVRSKVQGSLSKTSLRSG